VDDRIIRAMIADVPRDLRSVSDDVAVQRRWVEAVYAHLAPQSSAYTAISEWFSKQVPVHRGPDAPFGVALEKSLRQRGFGVTTPDRSLKAVLSAALNRQPTYKLHPILTYVLDELEDERFTMRSRRSPRPRIENGNAQI